MHNIKKLPKSEVEIAITVDEQTLLAAKESAYHQLSADVVVPGFRPGRAPREKIEAVLADRLVTETANIAIQKGLSGAVVDENLAPLDAPQITIDQFDGKALSFRAQFTVLPEVKVGDYKKLKIKTTKIRGISQDDVETSIKNIYESWIKQQPHLRPKGAPKGQAANSSQQTAVSSKQLRASISNDEFARAIGAENMANLRQLVKKDMEDIARSNAQMQDEKNILDALLAICAIEVPDILIEDEISRLVAKTAADLSYSGVKLADWLTLQNKTHDQLKQDLTEQASRNVKIQLALAQLARQESITAGNEEIDRELAKFNPDRIGVNPAQIPPQKRGNLRAYLAHTIIQAKTWDFLKRQLAI